MHIECPGRSIFQQDVESAAMGGYDFDALKNKTFLITGATGLIGGALVRTLLCANRLRGLNAKILAPVRSIEKAKTVLKGVFSREELTVFECSLEKEIQTEEKIDYIVHAASVTQSKLIVSKPVETIAFSLLSTMNLLDLARKKNACGMVYLSSMEAFGKTDPALERVTEKDMGDIDLSSVRSSYPESKRMCENMCVCFAREYGVPVVSARLAQTFGAGVNEGENRAFMQFARSAMEGKDIVLHTKGESYGNYVYLKDAVSAILVLLTRGEKGETYTVTNEDACVQIRDLARLAARTLSDPPVNVIFDIPEDPMAFGYAPDVKMHLSNHKLCLLGWAPTTCLKDMFLRMTEDIKQMQN